MVRLEDIDFEAMIKSFGDGHYSLSRILMFLYPNRGGSYLDEEFLIMDKCISILKEMKIPNLHGHDLY